MSNIDERSKQDFLIYANSVIKSRAIPSVEDNLKPIHRRILWSMYKSKFYNNKPTVKSAKVVGNVMGELHPHGDSSIYEAIVRLSQWWKLRYPLVEMQGNCGNILGDSAAASRYTECRLSKIGMFMLEDIDMNCVDTKPNFDNSCTEPCTLPSKFPYLLCGNNSGIAVGMGSDLVSHNFTEVMNAIEFYMNNKECSIADLMNFIKGPDFPTGGIIMNGEELLDIYTRGQGSVKVYSHYDISKKGSKTLITFHDLPYGVDIDDGIKKPLKKLVLEDGYEVFEDISVLKIGDHNFDITITLGKEANIAKCLEILFSKTKLASSIKINQNLIINGEPRVLSLKQMIEYWVNYRSNCIIKVAHTDYAETNHKLTVTIGLQKCLSDIDKLISLIRGSQDRATAKISIMQNFALNDEQAEAVLNMKLSRLSRLDLKELDSDKEELEKTLARIKEIIDDEKVRYSMILADLKNIKKVLGEDKRLTEIHYARPVVHADKPIIKQEYKITTNGIDNNLDTNTMGTLVDIVFAYAMEDILGYNKEGEISPIQSSAGYIGACVKNKDKNKFIAVTKNGNIKVTNVADYKFTKTKEKILKLKEDDELLYADFCSDNDFIMLFDGDQNVLKLSIADLNVASKLTVGVKSGFSSCAAAAVVSNSDLLLFVTKDAKGKYTSVQDFSVDNRGNKGQMICKDTICMRKFENEREYIYLIPKQGKMFTVVRNKIIVKGRTATGAALTSRVISTII